ncbi:MAG: hypothetical protein GKR99_03585 [Rhodobacteraceae bacterium]|nr:hypothetical protein [Paracoccaceae bacterium]
MPVILKDHGLAYFGIPKIASSSMKRVLFALECGEPFEKRTEASAHKPKALHEIYPSRPLARGDFKACADLWNFAVVRDPVDRILSAYGHRVVGLRDLEKRDTAKRKARLLRISLRPDLEEFCLKLDRYRLMSGLIRHHVDAQTRFLGRDPARLDAIFPIEKMADLTQALSERTGQQITMPTNSGTGPRFSRSELSPKATRVILRKFAADYRFLNGIYTPPTT